MKKEFRVSVVYTNGAESLVLLVRAASLKNAVRKLRYSELIQLPAKYHVYETGNHSNGVLITLIPAFVKYLQIPKSKAETISGYLHAKTAEQSQGEDYTISNTVVFQDGMQMDIKCCGAKDECSWTEAVLFDKNGCEVCCSEVSDRYNGTWELEYQKRRYVAIVRFG